MVPSVVLLLLVSRGALAEETTKTPDDIDKTTKEDSSNVSNARIFLPNFLNPSNTMNSGTLSGLAMLGFAGIAVVSLIVPFIMSAFGLALRPEMFGFKRSFGDVPWTNDLLRRYDNEQKPPPAALVKRLFDHLGVKDTECQKLLVCEVQRHPVTKFGTIGHTMSMLFSYPYSDNEIGSSLYKNLHEAWKRGGLNEDCVKIYSTCRMLANDVLNRLM